jgi:hypothetical protein
MLMLCGDLMVPHAGGDEVGKDLLLWSQLSATFLSPRSRRQPAGGQLTRSSYRVGHGLKIAEGLVGSREERSCAAALTLAAEVLAVDELCLGTLEGRSG